MNVDPGQRDVFLEDMERAGLSVPPDWEDGARVVHAELLCLAKSLREVATDAEDWPDTVPGLATEDHR